MKHGNKGKKPCFAPRNPYVVAAKRRKAGAHKKSTKAKRRHEHMEVWCNRLHSGLLIRQVRVRIPAPPPVS